MRMKFRIRSAWLSSRQVEFMLSKMSCGLSWSRLRATSTTTSFASPLQTATKSPLQLVMSSSKSWKFSVTRSEGSFGTGDDTRLGLPAWDSLEPYQPVTGWVAVSHTMLQNYGWKAAQERGREDLAFAWLDQYQPVGRVGRSILLYYIPANDTGKK